MNHIQKALDEATTEQLFSAVCKRHHSAVLIASDRAGVRIPQLWLKGAMAETLGMLDFSMCQTRGMMTQILQDSYDKPCDDNVHPDDEEDTP